MVCISGKLAIPQRKIPWQPITYWINTTTSINLTSLKNNWLYHYLPAACQPLDCRLMQAAAARMPLQGRADTMGGYCDPVAARPPSYTPPMGARHPVGIPDDDDAYDAPWDMANPGAPGNVRHEGFYNIEK